MRPRSTTAVILVTKARGNTTSCLETSVVHCLVVVFSTTCRKLSTETSTPPFSRFPAFSRASEASWSRWARVFVGLFCRWARFHTHVLATRALGGKIRWPFPVLTSETSKDRKVYLSAVEVWPSKRRCVFVNRFCPPPPPAGGLGGGNPQTSGSGGREPPPEQGGGSGSGSPPRQTT